jgi:hypothetical protein
MNGLFRDDWQDLGAVRMPAPRRAAPPQKQKGKGGFATSLISEGGALGGAALGAAAGSVVPVIGTAIGGIIGAGLGAYTGRLAENKIRDDDWRVGEAAKEGAITAATSAIIPGFKALKGAGAASKALGGVDDVAKAAKATAGKNPIDRVGREMYRATLGIDDIITPGKTKPTTIFKADELLDEAAQVGLKGTPKAMQRQVATQYDELGKELGAVLGQNSKSVPIKGKGGVFSTAVKDISDELPLKIDNASTQSELLRVTNELEGLASKGNISASGLQAFKDRLSGRLSNAFTKLQNGTDLNAKEAVDMAFWRRVDDAIGKVAPEAKALTTRQSRLYGLSQGLGRMTRSAGNPTGFGDLAMRAGAPAFRKGENTAGRMLMGIGNLGGGAGASSTARSAAMGGARQAIPGVIGEQMFNSVPSDPLEDALMQGQDGFYGEEDQQYGQMDAMGGFEDPMAGAGMEDPYPRENLMYDIQRDPENASDYIKYYKQMQEIFGPAAQPKMNAAQQQRALTSESGLRSLDVLDDIAANDPGAFARSALPNPFGLTARLTGTTDIRAATDNVVDVIARLRSGAAITDDEARRFSRQLPQAGDTPQAAMRKLQNVRAELESFANPGYAGGDYSLEDILMQRGSQY